MKLKFKPSRKPIKINFFQTGRMNLFSPVKLNTSKSVRKVSMKNLTWPQASVRFPRLNPFGDADRDGKLNIFDCHPFDRKRHSKYKIFITTLPRRRAGQANSENIPKKYKEAKELISNVTERKKRIDDWNRYSITAKNMAEQANPGIQEKMANWQRTENINRQYANRILKEYSGVPKQILTGEKPLNADGFMLLNEKDYHPEGDTKRDSKEEKNTISHERLHLEARKKHAWGKRVVNTDGEEYSSKERALHQIPQYRKTREWLIAYAKTHVPNASTKIINELNTVEKYYHDDEQKNEELQIRAITKFPEIIYKSNDPIFDEAKKLNTGIRRYGNTVYTKEEYSDTPENAESLKTLDIQDDDDLNKNQIPDRVEKRKSLIDTEDITKEEFDKSKVITIHEDED